MNRKHLVTVDSISDGKASLLLRMEESEVPLCVIPVSLLPDGVVTGDILSISFCAEPELTADVEKRVKALHERLLHR